MVTSPKKCKRFSTTMMIWTIKVSPGGAAESLTVCKTGHLDVMTIDELVETPCKKSSKSYVPLSKTSTVTRYKRLTPPPRPKRKSDVNGTKMRKPKTRPRNFSLPKNY